MFQKTKVKLTLLNASVLFLVLAVLGSAMFVYLRSSIIGKIDDTIVEWAGNYSVPAEPVQPLISGVAVSRTSISGISLQAVNLRTEVHTLVWSEGLALLSTRKEEKYTQRFESELQRSLTRTGIFTIRHAGGVYRVMNVPVSAEMGGLRVDYITGQSIGYYQLVSDISREVNMLNTVLGLIVVGIVFGGAISILAGLYLANRALVPIRSSWEKQQQFVADASHELRTPLAVLQTHTELLLRHPNHTIEQDSREISTILKEIQRMKKLVNGLLTLSQSDADKMELHMKPVALDRLATQVANQFMPLAALKDIDLSWRMESEATVNGDEERLQQLLMILLDNAIKYTPSGGTVRLLCRRSASHVTLKLEDSGIGIAAEELPRIF